MPQDRDDADPDFVPLDIDPEEALRKAREADEKKYGPRLRDADDAGDDEPGLTGCFGSRPGDHLKPED